MPYVLNGQQQAQIADPILRDGKHFVPMAKVVELLGGAVTWDNNTKTARATIGQWAANVQDGNPSVDVSGTIVNLTAAPYVEDGTLYVPWDFFRDAYGYKTSMDGDTLNVSL